MERKVAEQKRLEDAKVKKALRKAEKAKEVEEGRAKRVGWAKKFKYYKIHGYNITVCIEGDRAGISLCSRTDKFSKKKGREISEERMCNSQVLMSSGYGSSRFRFPYGVIATPMTRDDGYHSSIQKNSAVHTSIERIKSTNEFQDCQTVIIIQSRRKSDEGKKKVWK